MTLTHRYRRPPLARNEDYRIGVTGVVAPGDFVVRSSGDPQSRAGSITLDDVELSPDRRGYNLVATRDCMADHARSYVPAAIW